MSCNSSDQPTYCSSASAELKLYQAFIFSVPVFFTFILLLLFCVFYLRRQRASWQSMRMRASQLGSDEIQRSSESGIKKEVRELLPVVVFKESFMIRETQFSVCLGDYQSDEQLQRIPLCGHTFHVDCIDHWLTTNTTCPLCRVSLLSSTKSPSNPLQEQSWGNQTSQRIVQNENEAQERERVCASEAEETTTCGEESSVVVNITEENLRP